MRFKSISAPHLWQIKLLYLFRPPDRLSSGYVGAAASPYLFGSLAEPGLIPPAAEATGSTNRR